MKPNSPLLPGILISPYLWTIPFLVHHGTKPILESPNSKSVCSFPYVATTFKESQEIRKLNLIWQSIPNGKVGRVSSNAKKNDSKISLSNSVNMDGITTGLKKLLDKYVEYAENSHFLAIAVSKDIHSSIRQSTALNQIAQQQMKGRENIGPDDANKAADLIMNNMRRAFGGNSTFAEITNQISLGATGTYSK